MYEIRAVKCSDPALTISNKGETNMFNKVIMMGRIVNDIEVKTTQNGVNVATFRIAVDRRFQKQGEEKQSDFFNVTVWRQGAEFVQKYFGKGRMILVEGELNTRPYIDKNGNQATWYEIVADRVSFTGEKNGSASAQGMPPVQSAPVADGCGLPDDYPF